MKIKVYLIILIIVLLLLISLGTSLAISNGYEIGNNDWFLGKSVNEIDDQVTDSELPILLADSIFVDNEGNNKGTKSYSQNIYFNEEATFDLRFDQDDNAASESGIYLHFSDDIESYEYKLTFDNAVEADFSSAQTLKNDLEDNLLLIMDKNYTIEDITTDQNGIKSIIFKYGNDTVTISDGEIKINGEYISGITNYYAEGKIYQSVLDDVLYLDGFSYTINPNKNNLYLTVGDELIDPVFGTFKIVYSELVEDDKETIEVKTSGKKGTITFLNKDSKEISIFMYSSADANNIVYLGTTTTSTEVDNMIYLENTSCKATTSVSECKGAEFIVSAGSNCEAHLIKVSDINTVDTKISFEDLTYGTETNDYDYDNGTAFNPGLSGISDTIALTIGGGQGGSDTYINFTNLGTCYYPAANPKYLKMKTKNEGFVYMNYSLGGAAGGQGTSFTQPRITNISFAEYYDTGHAIANTVFLSETNNQLLQIDPIYDTSLDNVLELVFDKSGNVLSTSDTSYAFSKNDINDTDDGNKQTATYKGTIITLDDDSSKQSIVIEHPKVASYGKILISQIEWEDLKSKNGSDDDNDSDDNNPLGGYVCPSYDGEGIKVHDIDFKKQNGIADNTYDNGWIFEYFISVPENENIISMWINNWMNDNEDVLETNGNVKIIYDEDEYNIGSSHDYSESESFDAADEYPVCPGRQISFDVLIKLPEDTAFGYYSTSYGIKSEE